MTDNTSVTLPSDNLDPNSIAYAMARNEAGAQLPLRDALASIGIDPANHPTLKAILTSDAFKTQYNKYLKELRESGESFKLKARVQAEELLRTQWEIIHDKDAPATVRMKGIENVVEWADLKPKKVADTPPPASIQIFIDLGGEKPEVIDVTPTVPQIEDATPA